MPATLLGRRSRGSTRHQACSHASKGTTGGTVSFKNYENYLQFILFLFRKPNIFDNMLAIMEKYAYNLEGLVQERTNLLYEEKKKTDMLLYQMLPK